MWKLRHASSELETKEALSALLEDDEGEEDEDEGKAEVIIAKQRNGPTGTIQASFISKYARFENFSESETPF